MNPRIVSVEQLQAAVAELKQADRVVVLAPVRLEPSAAMTTLLQRARALGDCLIIALLTSDTATAEQLALLDSIDYLVRVSEDELVSLLQQLQPSYYVLLGEFTERDLPAVEAVLAYGGFAVVLPSELSGAQ